MKNTNKLMNYPVFSGKLQDISITGSRQVIHTINAYSYVLAERMPTFKTALQKADILLADGFPVVFASNILYKRSIDKIAGADLFFHFMDEMEKKKGKIFFLGSSNTTLSKIAIRIKKDYPNCLIETYSPPFKSVFSEEETDIMISKINAFLPDIVFVGMTAPKQEMWVESYKNRINAKAVCSIGAVFDFYAGTIRRAPKWMILMKLEWFYRLVNEPKRMWKRYLIYSPLFFWDLLLYLIRIKTD